jgi:hypothetical protein
MDGELLPDLLELARSAKEDSIRSMAISGAVRLATQEDTVKIEAKQRVAALKALMACASSAEQKRKVLAGLGEVGEVESLAVVEAALDDRSVCNEAGRAAVKITSVLPGSEAVTCEATLKRRWQPAMRRDSQGGRDALKQIRDNSDYLTNWEAAGVPNFKDWICVVRHRFSAGNSGCKKRQMAAVGGRL